MRKIAYCLLFLYVFTIPWEHSTDFGSGISSATRVAGVLAMLAGVAAVILGGSLRPFKTLHVTGAVFFLLSAASVFWTADADATAQAIRTLAQAGWVAWLIWEFASDVPSRRGLMLAYVAGCYVSAILTIEQFRAATLVANQEARFSADGSNANELALILALAIPFSALLLRRRNNLLVRVIGIVYLLLAPLTIVLTASRGGALVMLLAVMSVPLVLGGRGPLSKFRTAALLAFMVTVAIAIAPKASWDRLATTGEEITNGNVSDRVPVWRAGLRVFESSIPNALVGVGADGFLRSAQVGMVAHNTYLSVLVNYGVLGFALFATLLLQLTHAALRAPSSERLAMIVCFICWIIGVTSGTCEELRVTWFLFGIIAAAAFNIKLPAVHIPGSVSSPSVAIP
jgi:O-antigen ligase/polysaccharide polymerase Wzy-like membrane protein